MSTSPLLSAHDSAASAQADYRRLFDLSLDLLCVAGIDGYFKRVNSSWTRVLGWSEAELLSRPVVEFMHPEDRERTLQARANLARGEPVRGLENRYLCKDGSHRWLLWESTIEPGADTVFGVARDITERRQRDHERLAMSKLESTGILAGGMAHDFNNLLAALLMNIGMVRLTGSLAEEQEKYIRHAERMVDAARSLTDQLLTCAHGGESAQEIVDLKSVLQKSVECALSGSALRQECALAPDLWSVKGSGTQIGQVIRNLVLNAREATPAGGTVRFKAENVVLESKPGLKVPPGEYVRIGVADEGAGMTADVLTKAFDPYFSTKQRGQQKGMGLGLTICRTVIENHAGLIAIDSRPERGTTVTCHLPAARRSR